MGPFTRTSIFARRDDEGGRQFLAYRMAIAANEPIAMVLPVPVPAGAGEDALQFISLEGYAAFFEGLEHAFPAMSVSGAVAAAAPRSAAAPLEVQQVGAFEASFVPRRADFTRLPDQFKVRIEGVLSAEFGVPGKCRVFREWWHSAESPG